MVYAVMRYLGSTLALSLVLAAAGLAAATAQPDLPEVPVDEERDAPEENTAEEPESPPRPGALRELFIPDPGNGPSSAIPFPGDPSKEAEKYRNCLEMVGEDARGAVDYAFLWQAEGGTLAAKHCIAVAFVDLEEYALAAERLSDIARDLRTGRNFPDAWLPRRKRGRLIGELYAQLGNAWLMAGKPDEAYTAFSNGLADTPERVVSVRLELRIDRARASASKGDYESSLEDLKTAREQAPERGDIALYMASAHRAVGALDAALEAVERAIELDGKTATALLERGNIRMLMDAPDEARRNWKEVSKRWPDSGAAAAATTNLERLEHEVARRAREREQQR